MVKKKNTRRVRGADGKLHKKEEVMVSRVIVDAEDAEETDEALITTKGAISRGEKPSIQEKINRVEKDDSPVIIISYKDAGGKRITKQFTCDKIQMTENKVNTFQKSGPQTLLDIYIEASVIDVM